MIKIFAKKGTNEKVAIACTSEQVGEIQTLLNNKYGRSWVWVDKLLPLAEVIKFTDDMVYQGFDGKSERYSSSIERIAP